VEDEVKASNSEDMDNKLSISLKQEIKKNKTINFILE
jgi:hypothetical protein